VKATPPSAQVLREFSAYCEYFDNANTCDHLDRQIRESSARDLRYADDDELWHLVTRWVEDSRPFSLLRIGEGEGNVLFWGNHSPDYPALSAWCLEMIWRKMFGRSHTTALGSRLFYDMTAAIADADFLGIPRREEIEAVLEHGHGHPAQGSPSSAPRPDLWRGWTGFIADWDRLAVGSTSAQAVTHRRCHASITTHVVRLIQAAGNVSSITCYPGLMARLHRAAGVSDGEVIPIPPQAGNEGRAPEDAHFPVRFDEISDALAGKDLSGRLFFVAAGLLGKAYCRLIKCQGGMAIDVGSIVDVWEGRRVRPYHTHEFLVQSALPLEP
jgi:hypothetical protein